MKTKLLTLAFAVLILGGVILYNGLRVPQTLTPYTPPEHPMVAAPFPDLQFKTVDGQSLYLKDIAEPIVLVHFWAAWCQPCQAEFPDLLNYVANARGKVALMAIALDDHYADSQKMLSRIEASSHTSLSAPHLYWVWDDNKAISARMFNTIKVPETIIVNQQRQMIDKIVGVGPWADKPAGTY